MGGGFVRALARTVRRYVDECLASPGWTGPRAWWALLDPRRRRASADAGCALLLFTDLDGTLIDAGTYEPGESVAALARLRAAGVAVSVVTSKTFAEVLPLWEKLGLEAPFAVEGGAAVYFPRRLFPRLPRGARSKPKGKFDVIEAGPARISIVGALAEAARETGARVRGFAGMSISEVVALTGLSREGAGLAMSRVHSEPFLLLAGDPAPLEAALARRGLRLTRGGRFYHAVGPADKGTAARLILDVYGSVFGAVPPTAAVGDAPNDLPLLRAADRAFVVRGLTGEHDPLLLGAGAAPIDGVGPTGFVKVVEAILSSSSVAQASLGGGRG